MISKQKNTRDLSRPCPETVEFSDDKKVWVSAKLVSLETNTYWPYIATDGNQYKYCREIRNSK